MPISTDISDLHSLFNPRLPESGGNSFLGFFSGLSSGFASGAAFRKSRGESKDLKRAGKGLKQAGDGLNALLPGLGAGLKETAKAAGAAARGTRSDGTGVRVPFMEALIGAVKGGSTAPNSFRDVLEEHQDRREEAAAGIRNRIQEQQLQFGALHLELLFRAKQEQLESQSSLVTFADRINRSKKLGASEPEGQASVLDWVSKHRGVLLHEAGKALWEDYQNAVTADAGHKLKLEELRQRGPAIPDPIEINREITRLDQEAEASRIAGDTPRFQQLSAEARRLEASLSKGQSISVRSPEGFEVNIGSGGSATPQVGPTTSTRTETQKKAISYDVAISGLNDVMTKLRPEDVGVQGVIGENVFDRWLSQADATMLNQERVSNRTALRTLREALIPAMSGEDASRFSDQDVKRLRELTDGLQAGTSHGEVVGRLAEIKAIIQSRSRTLAERTGTPVPDFAKTPEEIAESFTATVAQLKAARDGKFITQDQYLTRVREAKQATESALRKYHNIQTTWQNAQ